MRQKREEKKKFELIIHFPQSTHIFVDLQQQHLRSCRWSKKKTGKDKRNEKKNVFRFLNFDDFAFVCFRFLLSPAPYPSAETDRQEVEVVNGMKKKDYEWQYEKWNKKNLNFSLKSQKRKWRKFFQYKLAFASLNTFFL